MCSLIRNLDEVEGRISGNEVATMAKEIYFINGKTHMFYSGNMKGA